MTATTSSTDGVVLLALGISGLGLSGVAIDVVRAALTTGAPAPHWPLGILPPTTWSARQVLLASVVYLPLLFSLMLFDRPA